MIPEIWVAKLVFSFAILCTYIINCIIWHALTAEINANKSIILLGILKIDFCLGNYRTFLH